MVPFVPRTSRTVGSQQRIARLGEALRSPAPRTSLSSVTILALVFLPVACQPTYEGDPQSLCAAVEDITETARALGPTTEPDLDHIAEHYRRLVGAYRGAADELDDTTASDEARHLARVVDEAAQDLEAIDDTEATSVADVRSEAIDEMGEIITSNLPIGLNDRAMEQIDNQCEPDYRQLPVP